MSAEPESLILQMLRDMRAEIGDVRSDIAAVEVKMSTKADLRADMQSLRADLASDMIVNRKAI